jgi:deoxyribodipyrimidine photolyase-related protein
MKVGILLPNQLFEYSELVNQCDEIYLVEEFLFFRQYPFHKVKLFYHRATMRWYADLLRNQGKTVHYIDSISSQSDIIELINHLATKTKTIAAFQPVDYLIERIIRRISKQLGIAMDFLTNPSFINSDDDNLKLLGTKKKYFQTDFYKQQRLRHKILIDAENNPLGGAWTFDTENRLRYPKNKLPPVFHYPKETDYEKEAMRYVESNFPDNPGIIHKHIRYPITFEDSLTWLNHFIESRLPEFGPYEDAIVANEHFLHHSVLTPMLNVGLLTPSVILDNVIQYSIDQDIPINSLEGFTRQILGWREFMRAVYVLKGVELRTTNYWKSHTKIPSSFWNGTTGIEPIDCTIRKILETGYCHHIERLMVLGNFMLLCEFDPDDVYTWFMSLFIDAYDWVMVPNVYGMSLFAGGPLMTTKPYFSGSNYLMKMSNYKAGPWQEIWDGLFWRYINKHRNFFLKNPRLSMMVRTWDKMSEDKKNQHLGNAQKYLGSL